MPVRRSALVLLAVAAALWAPGLARATEVSVAMDDGVHIFASVLEPSGRRPRAAGPA
jgi:hypothetical protein